MKTTTELMFITLVTMLLTQIIFIGELPNNNNFIQKLNSTIYDAMPRAPAQTDTTATWGWFGFGIFAGIVEFLISAFNILMDILLYVPRIVFGFGEAMFTVIGQDFAVFWGFPIIGPLVVLFWIFSIVAYTVGVIPTIGGK